MVTAAKEYTDSMAASKVKRQHGYQPCGRRRWKLAHIRDHIVISFRDGDFRRGGKLQRRRTRVCSSAQSQPAAYDL